MKNKLFLCVFLFTLFFPYQHASAQGQSTAYNMDPKTKAFLVICGYSVTGGALLGLASMAFGQDSKAIAQGASLGLYAGIIFGAYVVLTHGSEVPQVDSPNNLPSPYEDQFVPYQDGSSTYLNWNNSSSLAKAQGDVPAKDLLGPKIGWTWAF